MPGQELFPSFPSALLRGRWRSIGDELLVTNRSQFRSRSSPQFVLPSSSLSLSPSDTQHTYTLLLLLSLASPRGHLSGIPVDRVHYVRISRRPDSVAASYREPELGYQAELALALFPLAESLVKLKLRFARLAGSQPLPLVLCLFRIVYVHIGRLIRVIGVLRGKRGRSWPLRFEHHSRAFNDSTFDDGYLLANSVRYLMELQFLL